MQKEELDHILPSWPLWAVCYTTEAPVHTENISQLLPTHHTPPPPPPPKKKTKQQQHP